MEIDTGELNEIGSPKHVSIFPKLDHLINFTSDLIGVFWNANKCSFNGQISLSLSLSPPLSLFLSVSLSHTHTHTIATSVTNQLHKHTSHPIQCHVTPSHPMQVPIINQENPHIFKHLYAYYLFTLDADSKVLPCAGVCGRVCGRARACAARVKQTRRVMLIWCLHEKYPPDLIS